MARSRKNGSRLLALLLALALLTGAVIWDNNRVVVSRYEVTSAEIPSAFDGYRIVQISDLHSKSFGAGNHRLKEKVEGEAPDLILLTGDIINAKETDWTATVAFCGWLAQQAPTYFVVGNHELDRSYADYTRFLEDLLGSGVQLLDNQNISLKIDSAEIGLYGLYSSKWHYSERTGKTKEEVLPRATLETLLGQAKPERFNIMMTHSPDFFEIYAQWGADLTFAGHNHGGMVRLPIIGGLFSAGYDLFPQYDAGAYFIGDSEMIVSRGLGNSYAFRIFNPPELVSVTLKGE